MTIDVKGIKGMLLKWVLPVLINYLTDILTKMSYEGRQRLTKAIKEFQVNAKESENKYDDIMAKILTNLFGL